jgi:transcriptional regulator with XRE-family HTH domain
METTGNTELRDYLRSRRARISPAEAGLPTSPNRRVPGLRREEVAMLAGVSVDYYIRLERGRDLNVSEAVLDAVARALRLDETERGHLFTLARRRQVRRRPTPPQRVRPGLRRVVESMTDLPAVLVGHRCDVLASNRLVRALYTDFDALPKRERNMARYLFLDESARDLLVDWAGVARGTVAGLHLYAGNHPDDPRLAELVGELSVRSKEFRRWWADHDVARRATGTKTFRHPIVGELALDYEVFHPTGDPDLLLGLYTAPAGSPAEHALRLLAGWTADLSTTDSGRTN